MPTYFLRKRDYFTEIRERDLDEILEEIAQETSFTPDKVRIENELNTQSILETMLREQFDVARLFPKINPFSIGDTYRIGDLVEYSVAAYDTSATYSVNDRVSYQQKSDEGRNIVLTDDIYYCSTEVTAAEDFDFEKWTKVTENYCLYYCTTPSVGNLPDTAFAYTTNAYTGNHDLITGWDKTQTLYFERDETTVNIYYSAADRTAGTNTIGTVDYDPVANAFPDNRPIASGSDTDNVIGGTLSFIGFVPDATTWDVVPSNYFVKGDNRYRDLKKILVNLAICELHKLISARNVPQHRLEAKDDAMDLVKKILKGDYKTDWPRNFEESWDAQLVWGSKTRRSWDQ